MTRGVLLLLLMSLGALGRPLSGSAVLQTTAERRQLAEDLNLVLSLDASSGDLSGDATWPSADPSVSVKLTGAGYDAAYEGSVSFTPPAASGDVGTYGQSSELLAVRDAAWGSEFTALVWYKGAQPAGSNAVLLQVAYTDETSGDLKPSATWRVGGFSDDTQGSRPLSGFRAQPTWGALEDCWQQLAVVKSGPELTFYRNGEEAGTAAASFVVPDYGATTIGLGVEIASLAEPGTNGTAPTVNPAALDADLGWLSGSIATLAVYSRALAAEDIAAAYTASAPRFAEGACKADAAAPAPSPAEPPAPAEPNQPDNTTEPAENSPAPVDPTPSDNATTPGSPDTTTQSPEPASPAPVDPSPTPVDPTASPAPVDPTASPGPVDPTASPSPAVPIPSPAVPSPSPVPSPVPQPQPPAKSNSTFDNSTAEVEGSGTQGRVANTLTITGDDELADFENDAQKQSELRRAIVNSLNLEDDEFGEDNVEIKVVKKERRRRKEVTVEVYEWVVVCDYVLLPTPKAPVEVLVKAEINVYLFIRVQQPVMPWWKGDKASVCISDKEGECRPQTPPIPPPVKEESCSANVCFLLDGSKSLINVDAWNDVVASARSIMYSVADPAAVFDVFWFSNDVERIGKQVTGAEVAADNKFIKEVMNTVPNAHGTFMAQAIQTCQDVLLEETEGPSKTIVLITDGKPTDQPDALEAAAEARKRGIKMVTVGAGDIDYDILKQLSSGPSYVFANFQLDASGLLKVADLASRGVCRELD